MEKTKKVHFDVWDYNITIVYADDIPTARKKRNNILEDGGDLTNVVGLHCCISDKYDAWIFLSPKCSAGDIAHECSHAIKRMFRFFDGECAHEHFEYHLGYLVDKAHELKHKAERSPN